ncbi:hypothetical protein FF1_023410 [Malus domestica]
MLCCFCSASLGSEHGFTAVRLGILLHCNSSRTSNLLWGSSCFSRARFLVKTKGSEDAECTPFDATKTRKFPSSLPSHVIKYFFWYVMVLRSSSSALAPTSSSRMLAATSSSNI